MKNIKQEICTFTTHIRNQNEIKGSCVINVYAGDAPTNKVNDSTRLLSAYWVSGENRIRLPREMMNVVAEDRPGRVQERWYNGRKITEETPYLSRAKQICTTAIYAINAEVQTRVILMGETEFNITNAKQIYWFAWKQLLQTQGINVTLNLIGFEMVNPDDADRQPRNLSNEQNFDRQPQQNHRPRQQQRHHDPLYEEQRKAALSMTDDDEEDEVLNELKEIEQKLATEEELKKLVTPSAKKPRAPRTKKSEA